MASNRVAVVTGSSSGIGRAIALELARDGCSIVVHAAHSAEAARAVEHEIVQLGREATVILQDFSKDLSPESLVDQAYRWQGRLDVWINNAGADVLTGDAAKWSFEDKLQAVLQVDVLATLLLSREAGRVMRQQFQRSNEGEVRRCGVILNMGWDQAFQGMAGDSGEMFAAAKGAIMAASLSLAQSLAPTVRVNCLAPGWIRTDWADDASAAWDKRARSQSLLQRWGSPQDVARAARFLCSDESEFINGQVVPINGGFNFYPERQ